MFVHSTLNFCKNDGSFNQLQFMILSSYCLLDDFYISQAR